MPRRYPIVTDKNSSFAFFLLVLYVAAVLIRPHEMSYDTSLLPVIKWLAIICLVITLGLQRPLKLYAPHIMITFLIPLIIMSGFLNGSGMWGISQSISFFTACIIPMFLVSNCTSSVSKQEWLMIISIIAALFMVHNGHYQQTDPLWQGWAYGTQAYPLPGTDARRITYLGLFSDPNDIGMFFVMNIPFIAYFFVKGNGFKKLIMLFVLAVILYGVQITHSRGTLLGVVSLIGIYYLVVKAGAKLFIASILSIPVAIVVLTILQRNVDESASGRLEAWYAGILMMTSYPLGIGKGAFVDHHGLTAHNSFILVAGELGFLGYSLWGGAILSIVLAGYFFIKKVDKDSLNDEQKSELLINKTLFFSMCGFMVTAFFLSRSYTVLLFIFIGMTIGSHHRVITKIPELANYFTSALATRCMLYSWSVIVVVYIALKIAL